MVQFKAISKQDTSRDFLAKFERASAELKRDVLTGLAQLVTSLSPVDTGNYVLSHEIVAGGRDGGFPSSPTNSHGLPGRQDPESKRGQALGTLLGQIAGVQAGDTAFMLRNSAVYAYRVEYGGWGAGTLNRFVGVTNEQRAEQAARATQPYRVYALARAEAPALIAEAITRFKAS